MSPAVSGTPASERPLARARPAAFPCSRPALSSSRPNRPRRPEMPFPASEPARSRTSPRICNADCRCPAMPAPRPAQSMDAMALRAVSKAEDRNNPPVSTKACTPPAIFSPRPDQSRSRAAVRPVSKSPDRNAPPVSRRPVTPAEMPVPIFSQSRARTASRPAEKAADRKAPPPSSTAPSPERMPCPSAGQLRPRTADRPALNRPDRNAPPASRHPCSPSSTAVPIFPKSSAEAASSPVPKREERNAPPASRQVPIPSRTARPRPAQSSAEAASRPAKKQEERNWPPASRTCPMPPRMPAPIPSQGRPLTASRASENTPPSPFAASRSAESPPAMAVPSSVHGRAFPASRALLRQAARADGSASNRLPRPESTASPISWPRAAACSPDRKDKSASPAPEKASVRAERISAPRESQSIPVKKARNASDRPESPWSRPFMIRLPTLFQSPSSPARARVSTAPSPRSASSRRLARRFAMPARVPSSKRPERKLESAEAPSASAEARDAESAEKSGTRPDSRPERKETAPCAASRMPAPSFPAQSVRETPSRRVSKTCPSPSRPSRMAVPRRVPRSLAPDRSTSGRSSAVRAVLIPPSSCSAQFSSAPSSSFRDDSAVPASCARSEAMSAMAPPQACTRPDRSSLAAISCTLSRSAETLDSISSGLNREETSSVPARVRAAASSGRVFNIPCASPRARSIPRDRTSSMCSPIWAIRPEKTFPRAETASGSPFLASSPSACARCGMREAVFSMSCTICSAACPRSGACSVRAAMPRSTMPIPLRAAWPIPSSSAPAVAASRTAAAKRARPDTTAPMGDTRAGSSGRSIPSPCSAGPTEAARARKERVIFCTSGPAPRKALTTSVSVPAAVFRVPSKRSKSEICSPSTADLRMVMAPLALSS